LENQLRPKESKGVYRPHCLDTIVSPRRSIFEIDRRAVDYVWTHLKGVECLDPKLTLSPSVRTPTMCEDTKPPNEDRVFANPKIVPGEKKKRFRKKSHKFIIRITTVTDEDGYFILPSLA
jgi:hypothetical protein